MFKHRTYREVPKLNKAIRDIKAALGRTQWVSTSLQAIQKAWPEFDHTHTWSQSSDPKKEIKIHAAEVILVMIGSSWYLQFGKTIPKGKTWTYSAPVTVLTLKGVIEAYLLWSAPPQSLRLPLAFVPLMCFWEVALNACEWTCSWIYTFDSCRWMLRSPWLYETVGRLFLVKTVPQNSCTVLHFQQRWLLLFQVFSFAVVVTGVVSVWGVLWHCGL